PPGIAYCPAKGSNARFTSKTFSSSPDWMVKITMSTVSFMVLAYNQMRSLFGGSDVSDGAGVELQEVRFHAVAENHATGRHEGFEDQLFAWFDQPGHNACLRVFAQEGFANDVEKAAIVPCDTNRLPRHAAREGSDSRRHVKSGRYPAGRARAGGNENAA